MRFELTTTGATSRRSVQLSYGHRDHDRNRTCVSGFAGPHLAARSRGRQVKHACGIEPAASRFGAGCSSTGELPARGTACHQCVGRDLNPQGPIGSAGVRPAAMPVMRPTPTKQSAWKDSNLRPIACGDRDTKLRHTLKPNLTAPGGNRTRHSPVEGRTS